MNNKLMKRILLFIFWGVTTQVFSQTKINMIQVFKQMPDSVIGYLSENNRLDMIDFMEADMESVVTNKLDGNTKLICADSSYIKLQLNKAVELEMKLLPYDGETKDSSSYVVCLVSTYGVNLKESKVKFYTAKWNEIDIPNPLEKLNYKKLLVKSDTLSNKRFDELVNIPDVYMFKASLSQYDNTISIKLTTNDLPKEDNEKILSVLSEKKYFWKGRLFK